MNKTKTQNSEVAQEIFRQLKVSRVNGFPFFAYSGIKPSIFSDTALYLKLPKNPSAYKSILIEYDYGSDTYNVNFYTDVEPLKATDRHTDVYADSMVDLIVSEMKIR